MRKLLSCEFNIDTACVELKFSDGALISIDCTAVEDEVAKNMYQRSELDSQESNFLICAHSLQSSENASAPP